MLMTRANRQITAVKRFMSSHRKGTRLHCAVKKACAEKTIDLDNSIFFNDIFSHTFSEYSILTYFNHKSHPALQSLSPIGGYPYGR